MTHYQKLHKRRGFTLIEFMIASALGLVVLAIVGSLYGYTKRLNSMAENRLIVHQNLRVVSDLIMRDARQAGNFGCLSLGRLYSADEDMDFSDQFKVDYGEQAKKLNDSLKVDKTAGRLAVRWVDFNELPTAADLGLGDFTATSKALMFFYGEGSTTISEIAAPDGLNKDQSKQNITVTYNDKGSEEKSFIFSPIVSNTIANGGFLVLASCRAMGIFKPTAENTSTIAIPYPLKIIETRKRITTQTKFGGVPANLYIKEQLELLRYTVVAYVVGKTTSSGNVTGLYRFELAEDGKWRGPELLISHVSDMQVTFYYPTDADKKNQPILCQQKDKDIDLLNGYKISSDGGQDGFLTLPGIVDSNHKPRYVSPALMRLALNYDYPQIGAKKLNFQSGEQNNLFIIQAAIRGGNNCANRILDK